MTMVRHSSEFNFPRRYRQTGPYRMHYIDIGTGSPALVFLHGNPTWSYLWRNVIPPLARHHRCVAVDLLGFGGSDRPDIDYTFPQHYTAVRGFLEQAVSGPVALVLHDWGGLLGINWALDHPDRVWGVAFMETFPFLMEYTDYPKSWKLALELLRAPGIGVLLNQWLNWQVPLMLKLGVLDRATLSPEILAQYTGQFPSAVSRRPVGRFTRMLPIKKTDESVPVVRRIIEAFPKLECRKLLIQGDPGAVITDYIASQLKTRIPGLESASVGPARHFLPEEQPDALADLLDNWISQSGT